MKFRNLFKQFTRHPFTRGAVGFALTGVSILGTASIIQKFSDKFLYRSTLPLYFLATYSITGTMEHLYKTWFINNPAEQTKKFDSTETGKTISNTIKEICKNHNINVPYRLLDHGNDIHAGSQGFPYPSYIEISKGTFKAIENKTHSYDKLHATLAHELGHIRRYHTLIKEIPLVAANFVKNTQFQLYAFTIIVLGWSLATSSDFLNIDASYSMLPFFHFCLTELNTISKVGRRIIARACETDADLIGCKLSSVQIMIKKREQSIKDKESLPITFSEWITQPVKSMTKYYDSWLEIHPTNRERVEDIKTFYPAYRNC